MLLINVVIQDGVLLSYSVGVSGALAVVGQPWNARIDMDPGPRGSGLASHPLLHCHVGEDDTSMSTVRVPVPWMPPERALEWLMATACPGLQGFDPPHGSLPEVS